MKYSDLLRDPRWQKKRLEVLSSANFTCCRCQSTTRNIQVHHKKYRKGALPWEYENDQFEVLCDLCHEKEHAELTDEELKHEQLIDKATRSMLSSNTTEDRRGYFSALKMLVKQRSPETVRKLELQKGLAK